MSRALDNKAITYFKINELNPDLDRLARIPIEKVERIAGSIDAFGFNSPIVVTPEKEILAGNARYLAARSILLTEVPCIVVTEFDKVDRQIYCYEDNDIQVELETPMVEFRRYG